MVSITWRWSNPKLQLALCVCVCACDTVASCCNCFFIRVWHCLYPPVHTRQQLSATFHWHKETSAICRRIVGRHFWLSTNEVNVRIASTQAFQIENSSKQPYFLLTFRSIRPSYTVDLLMKIFDYQRNESVYWNRFWNARGVLWLTSRRQIFLSADQCRQVWTGFIL